MIHDMYNPGPKLTFILRTLVILTVDDGGLSAVGSLDIVSVPCHDQHREDDLSPMSGVGSGADTGGRDTDLGPVTRGNILGDKQVNMHNGAAVVLEQHLK